LNEVFPYEVQKEGTDPSPIAISEDKFRIDLVLVLMIQ